MEVGGIMTKRKIISLAIGKPKEFTWNNCKEQSAIGKEIVEKAVLKRTGFIGDGVANEEFHGGIDRAICLYSYEHYADWEKLFQKELTLPAFGENVTVEGMKESEVCIGDIYKIGDVVMQVTQGRIPCSTISKYNQEEQFLKTVFETGLTGYFSRVLEEGTICQDSKIELLQRHPKEISVLLATQTLLHHHDNEAIEKILSIDELAEDWRNRFLKLL